MSRNNVSLVIQEDPKLVKDVLRNVLPILAAKSPNRPSPVHVANNFITLALGQGTHNQAIKEWVTSASSLEAFLSNNEKELEASAELLRKLVSAIFDSDGNVYAKIASPFPLVREVTGRDPSDDGYAAGLWQSLGDVNRLRLTNALFEFYSTKGQDSSIARFLNNLMGESSLGRTRDSRSAGETTFGVNIGELISEGLENKLNLGTHAKIEIARQLSVLMGAFATIGMLYDACNSRKGVGKKLDAPQVLGTFCYTGAIGSRNSVEQRLGRLAAISLGETISRAHIGIVDSFNKKIADLRKKNPNQKWSQFSTTFATEYLDTKSAAELIKIFRSHDEESILTWVEQAYPAKHLRKAVRGLGTKSGMIWSTSKGDPRIVLDTSFLTALSSFIGEPDMPVEDFVESVYRKLGLVIGFSGVSDQTIKTLQKVAGPRYEIRESLQKAEELLTGRMVSAGLARKYSDGSASILGGSL